MSYGKPMKKNFYTEGRGDIAMPAEGEMPPVLADNQSDWSANNQSHPMIQNNIVEEREDVVSNEHQESDGHDNDESEAVEESREVAETSQQKQKTKSIDENFRNLREARERAEWERDTLKGQMLEMQRAMQGQYPSQLSKNQQQPEPEIDDFNFDVADDALLEGKDAKRLVQELQNVKKQLKKFSSQSTETAVEAKIRATYPDFNNVVSQENVSRLNEEYPEIAQTLRDTPDLYNKASAAYSIMKKFGIYKDMTYEEDKMKAIKNAQKPRPVASVNPQQGDSPLSKANAFANGLSKDLQKQLLEEMKMARRNL